MQDANAKKKPEENKHQETVKTALECFLKVRLEPLPESSGDYVNPKTGTTYKLKAAPPGEPRNFLLEILASANPEHFEKGWLYRYQALDYLAYYSDNQIFLYAYKPLCKFFWDNFLEKTTSGGWKIGAGEGNDPWSIAILVPSKEFDQCLRKTIPMKQAPPAKPEDEASEPEIPDEAPL